MEKYIQILSACPLFAGMEPKEILAVLDSLDAKEVKLARGKFLFHEGDPARIAGVVLSGTIQIFRNDGAGEKNIIVSMGPGSLLGESYICAGLEAVPASAVAAEDARMLLLNYKKLFDGGDSVQWRLVQNMLRSVAQKNLLLNRKMHILTRRTTREKLMAFLTDQAERHGSAEFSIDFDRQALADYLGVDRCALSVVIGKLKKSGAIECDGRWFRLH